MFKTVSIIGFGLIGSSLARALRKYELVEHIVAIDSSDAVCETALELGIADEATTSVQSGVEGAEIVILSTPVGSYEAVCKAMADTLPVDAVVTDVGSVKASVMDQVKALLPDGNVFIPAHPISGTENSGPEAGFAELFENRWCILTPDDDVPDDAVQKIKSLWSGIGANVEIMDASHHDLVLAMTSHLPHLIAYTVVGTAADLEDQMRKEVISFSAGGFRDFTRIAASNPVMWRDIFLQNKEAVLESLQRFTEDLASLQRAIRWGDGDMLEEYFTRTRDIRKQVIDAGQGRYKTAIGSQESMPAVSGPQKASGS